MVEKKSCMVCGKPSTRVLFKGGSAEVCICSATCENQYLESLSNNRGEQQKVLQHLDKEIRRNKKYETIGWLSAGIGLLLVMLGVFWANLLPTKSPIGGSTLFLIGIIPLTGGAVATLYFSGRKERLTWKRRQLT